MSPLLANNCPLSRVITKPAIPATADMSISTGSRLIGMLQNSTHTGLKVAACLSGEILIDGVCVKLVSVFLLVAFVAGCASPPPPPRVVVRNPVPVRDVGREAQGWRLVDEGALLIDLRDPEVYAHSHLAHAINIPLPEIIAGHKKFPLIRNQLIVVYGGRAERAGATRALLTKHGFANAHDAGSYEVMLALRPGSSYFNARFARQDNFELEPFDVEIP